MTREEELYEIAYLNYLKYYDKVKNHDYLVVVDYRQPSYEKRFYVFSLETGDVIRKHHVAHGNKSSDPSNPAYAKYFGNDVGSRKSSLGALVTAETYYGKHGLSLKLDGLEKGFNDNIRKRYIVIHTAPYVSDSFIKQNGYAGRSDGCLALDKAVYKEVIDMIKGGTFIYSVY